jgi:glyoxylase-like metal-dependent hydrolase (beta-lactamase superfamily II)
MYFDQILHDHGARASYLIASRQSGEAAVVDPGPDPVPYGALLRERALILRFVIDTRVHDDHLTGARRLAANHGAALCLPAAAPVAYPFHPLADGDVLQLGSLRLRALHTRWRRRTSISLVLTDTARSTEPRLVLTDEFPSVGEVGQPDLNGDAAARREIVSRLLQLPDWVAIFPGRITEPGGALMDGRPITTVGYERLADLPARSDRAAFVAGSPT